MHRSAMLMLHWNACNSYRRLAAVCSAFRLWLAAAAVLAIMHLQHEDEDATL